VFKQGWRWGSDAGLDPLKNEKFTLVPPMFFVEKMGKKHKGGEKDDFFRFFQKIFQKCRVGPYFWPFCRMG
jgi:hypothetical protein